MLTDIILFAAIAGFIAWRLKSVLGKRIGHEIPPPEIRREPIAQQEKIIHLPGHREEEQEVIAPPSPQELGDPQFAKTVMAMQALDRQFSAKKFLQGARTAFEMVLEALNKTDKKTLRMLVSEEVYQDFSSVMEHQGEEREERTLVSLEDARITEAQLKGTVATLTVSFVSEQIVVVRSRDGTIVRGDPGKIDKVLDQWTFERNLSSSNPNWKLVAA
ncbi:MAG: Tim44 domain-containing protein [Alphaproteobacteria bacterium]|nr:Tim44 domain-containing protein [Alphaproteobacteria bacterium]